MTILFIILIVLACVILSLIVLVQNPKGGGLAGTFGGVGNQLMGVKQTTDILEKGTWTFAGIIAVLCIISTLFIKGGEVVAHDRIQNVSNGPIPQQQVPPQQNQPLNPQGQPPKTP